MTDDPSLAGGPSWEADEWAGPIENAWPDSDTQPCAREGEHLSSQRHPFQECPTYSDEEDEDEVNEAPLSDEHDVEWGLRISCEKNQCAKTLGVIHVNNGEVYPMDSRQDARKTRTINGHKCEIVSRQITRGPWVKEVGA